MTADLVAFAKENLMENFIFHAVIFYRYKLYVDLISVQKNVDSLLSIHKGNIGVAWIENDEIEF